MRESGLPNQSMAIGRIVPLSSLVCTTMNERGRVFLSERWLTAEETARHVARRWSTAPDFLEEGDHPASDSNLKQRQPSSQKVNPGRLIVTSAPAYTRLQAARRRTDFCFRISLYLLVCTSGAESASSAVA